MTDRPSINSLVQWQDGTDDGIGEPALMISAYNGHIGIVQGSDSILINEESIDELIKNLRKLQKLQKEGKLK